VLILDAVRLALAQIRAQKLRSFFTLLGVTVGVMFLIGVVSVVSGMARYVEEDFGGKFLGINTFNLRRFPDINTGDVSDATWRRWQQRPKITVEDGEAVRAAMPAGVRWSLDDTRWYTPRSEYSRGGPQNILEAVSADFFAIKNLKVTKGRVFTAEEDARGAPVVVIGTESASELFPHLDPIGREVRIDGLPYTVIGLLETQGTVFGLSLDRQIIGPFNSPMSRADHARAGLYGVVVQGPSQDALTDAEERAREVMRRRHHLRPAEPDDFVFETSDSALSDWLQIKTFLFWGGLLLPSVGLIVGAILIMNIMLVSVTERTREIGIRKSLGARRRDILNQFLVEATTLSMLGAIAGIGLGVVLSRLVATLSPLPATIAPWSLVAGVIVGAGVGIASGVYPASRAARLDPIVALRSE
jgi:putative ABC transport system permease protein